jgi:hypothetical protein
VDLVDEDLIATYATAVVDQQNLVEHPEQDDPTVYITETRREEGVFWSDLDKKGRAKHLRRLLVRKALEAKTRCLGFTYSDAQTGNGVQEAFERDLHHRPSVQYAYDLMEHAANQHDEHDVDEETSGFTYGTHRGQKKLRVNIANVASRIVEDVLDEWEHLDRQNLARNGLITSYTSGSPPQQGRVADD